MLYHVVFSSKSPLAKWAMKVFLAGVNLGVAPSAFRSGEIAATSILLGFWARIAVLLCLCFSDMKRERCTVLFWHLC